MPSPQSLSRRNVRFSAGWLLLFFALSGSAQQPGHPVTMWRLDGEANRIWLLGSVHVLRADDHPIPSVMLEAYDDAETLIMEMDMDDLDPVETQQLLSELGLIKENLNLKDLMGPERYARAKSLADRADIPLSLLDRSEPWLAAVTVEQMMLARIGFDPRHGVESYLAEKAMADRKEILGLETMRQQFGFLDSMTLASQRALLLQSLEESADIQNVMDDLIEAWRYGDIRFLKETMLDEMQDYPELYQTLVVRRNMDWTEQIVELLDDKEDYLVIIGALHLIGDEGLPALLAERGLKVTQQHEKGQ